MSSKAAVKQGDILIKEEPFVYILSSKYRLEYCDYCFQGGKFYKRCTGCQYVHYCSRACQKEAWPVHKQECSSIKRVAPKVLPDAARILARLIRKLNKGGDFVKSYYSDGNFRMFKNLMSHYSDLKEDRVKMDHFTSLCGVLFEFMGQSSLPNVAELMGIYGRMCVNSFSICDSEMASLGTGIYLAASVMDHSCQPNAIATFEGTTLFVRAVQDLPYLDWKEIRISYIDVMNTPLERQAELRKIYYFTCQCIKCVDIDLPLVPQMTGAACPNHKCDACIDVASFTTVEDRYCKKCNTEVTDTFLDEFRTVTELSEVHLKGMKDIGYIDICKFCLQRQKGILYKFNLQHVQMLGWALQSSIDLDHLEYAKTCAYELIEPYKFYYDKFNPMLGLLYFMVGKLSVMLDCHKEALKYLKLAFDIFKVTHGNSHSLLKTELMPMMYEAKIKLNIT